jgi:hypothetical protein
MPLLGTCVVVISHGVGCSEMPCWKYLQKVSTESPSENTFVGGVLKEIKALSSADLLNS